MNKLVSAESTNTEYTQLAQAWRLSDVQV